MFENKEAKKLFPLGVVTGLLAEARIARPLGAVEIGGGRPEGAALAAERLVARGVRALLSFGLAGGLDPALAAGALVIPAAVIAHGMRYPTDPAFGDAAGAVLAGDTILASVAAKRAAFLASGALAVDLESGAVARVATRHGLPFAVLRAVCDPAGRALPPAALAALDSAGAIGAWRVLASVLAHPGQVPALLRLAGDAAQARRALKAWVARSSGGS